MYDYFLLPCRDGRINTLFQTNVLFAQHPDALKLSVYNDDIEVGNVLGSKAGINKITMYYFQILNNSDLSSLSNIHLALVAYASDVKQFGHNHILAPFIDDLKRLELGITIGDSTVYGTVTHLPADNLAANESQGFVASFSANHFCRFCKMHSSHTQCATQQDSTLLRTKASQALDLLRSTQDPSTSSSTGVKSGCAFDELKYFSPVESFAPDVMHDVFEGIAKREISLLLKHLIDNKVITMLELNGIIKSFDYG